MANKEQCMNYQLLARLSQLFARPCQNVCAEAHDTLHCKIECSLGTILGSPLNIPHLACMATGGSLHRTGHASFGK